MWTVAPAQRALVVTLAPTPALAIDEVDTKKLRDAAVR
jgi:hypothetical protein